MRWDLVKLFRLWLYWLQKRKRELKVKFILDDMREYRSPSHFDVILNLFGSFAYFEDTSDDLKVVKNMYESLRPGGQFLIETMGKEILARDFQARTWNEEGDLLVLSEKGELVLVKATPERFEEITRFPVLKGKTWNHPIVVDGVIYVRNAEEAAAYRLPT